MVRQISYHAAQVKRIYYGKGCKRTSGLCAFWFAQHIFLLDCIYIYIHILYVDISFFSRVYVSYEISDDQWITGFLLCVSLCQDFLSDVVQLEVPWLWCSRLLVDPKVLEHIWLCLEPSSHMIFGSFERCRNELQQLQFGSSWDSLCTPEVDAWRSFDQWPRLTSLFLMICCNFRIYPDSRFLCPLFLKIYVYSSPWEHIALFGPFTGVWHQLSLLSSGIGRYSASDCVQEGSWDTVGVEWAQGHHVSGDMAWWYWLTWQEWTWHSMQVSSLRSFTAGCIKN